MASNRGLTGVCMALALTIFGACGGGGAPRFSPLKFFALPSPHIMVPLRVRPEAFEGSGERWSRWAGEGSFIFFR